jgi:PAS domain S-box-containing protein
MLGETWRILHIDDDEDDHFIVRSMLSEAQGRKMMLDWASSFQEGHQKLIANHYHAILVDYDLGIGTGIDLIREFVERGYTAPMILLTGRGSYAVDVEAMRAGATLYLTKNEINPLLLERSIRYAIERKEAEAALRERDRKLSVALNAAQLGAWVYTFADQVMEMDERAQQLYRASQARENHEELVQQFFHPEDIQAMRAALRSAADPAGEGRYHVEYRIIQPDQSACWLNAWGQVEFEGEGPERRAVRMVGASRDITWEKQARLEMEEIAGRFKAVLENSLDVAYRRNMQTSRFDYMSPLVEQVLGFRVDEIMAMSPQEILERIHPEDQPEMMRQLMPGVATGNDRLEYRFKGKDGHYRWLADHASVILDANGVPLYRTGIVRDVTEPMQAARALQISEERFQLASRAVSGVLYDWSIGREELYQSEGLERVVGYRPGEEPGGSRDWWPRNIHPDDIGRVQETLQAAIDAGTRSFSYEYRIRHREGHWVHIWDQGHIVRDDRGQAQRVVGLATDITERVQVETMLRENEARLRQSEDRLRKNSEALRESEARFRDLANNISQLAWMADETGQILWYNQRWFDYTGTTLEEMQALGWQRMHHPDHLQRVVEKFNRCLATGAFWEDTFPLRGQDGQYRWFLSRATPIQNENQQVVRWFGTNTDITEQMGLQRENQLQKNLLERVLQVVPVGIWISGPNGQLISKNEQADRIWAGDAPLVESIDQYRQYIAWYSGSETYLTPEEYPAARALRTGQVVEPVELQIRRFDGTEGTVLVSAAPLMDEEGQITAVVSINVDITERKQAEVELRKNSEALQKLAEALEIERAKLAAAIDQLPVGLGIADASGNTLSMNTAGLKIHGFASLTDMYSRLETYIEDFELRDMGGKPMPLEAWPASKALRGEFVQEYELRLYNRNAGTECILSYSAAPVYNSEGDLTLIVYVIQDLTERRQAEEALRVSEAAMNAFFEASPAFSTCSTRSCAISKPTRLRLLTLGLIARASLGNQFGILTRRSRKISWARLRTRLLRRVSRYSTWKPPAWFRSGRASKAIFGSLISRSHCPGGR